MLTSYSLWTLLCEPSSSRPPNEGRSMFSIGFGARIDASAISLHVRHWLWFWYQCSVDGSRVYDSVGTNMNIIRIYSSKVCMRVWLLRPRNLPIRRLVEESLWPSGMEEHLHESLILLLLVQCGTAIGKMKGASYYHQYFIELMFCMCTDSIKTSFAMWPERCSACGCI